MSCQVIRHHHFTQDGRFSTLEVDRIVQTKSLIIFTCLVYVNEVQKKLLKQTSNSLQTLQECEELFTKSQFSSFICARILISGFHPVSKLVFQEDMGCTSGRRVPFTGFAVLTFILVIYLLNSSFTILSAMALMFARKCLRYCCIISS